MKTAKCFFCGDTYKTKYPEVEGACKLCCKLCQEALKLEMQMVEDSMKEEDND